MSGGSVVPMRYRIGLRVGTSQYHAWTNEPYSDRGLKKALCGAGVADDPSPDGWFDTNSDRACPKCSAIIFGTLGRDAPIRHRCAITHASVLTGSAETNAIAFVSDLIDRGFGPRHTIQRGVHTVTYEDRSKADMPSSITATFEDV